uniref:Complex I assembly factor TIMMDC1, mitochondrial n=1 Tax=Lygus hesperus TaxID=30085 RepID=A0A0A9YM68_LYGHE
MLRQMFRSTCMLCSAVVAPKTVGDLEVNEGWERVKRIFDRDEIGAFSPEMNTIYQTTFLTAFTGACYGGFIHSREAYLRFFERNQATQFTDHFEAKKKLQDYVTVNFAKGALKWSWRLALFGGFYTSIVTIMSSYRGESSILDFVVGGIVSGGIYRVNYGLRGVIVGSTLGMMIGLMGGSLTMTILRLTDTSLDDVRKYQLEYQQFRDKNLAEAAKKPLMEVELKEETGLTRAHDARIASERTQTGEK